MKKFKNDMDEFLEDKWMKNQTYYHGTSSIFDISELKPPIDTGILREENRKNNQNVIYITTSLGSAWKYAYKTVEKYGGNPVVYIIEPDYDSLRHRIDHEYIVEKAKIIRTGT